jgi:hypothetical protein
MSDKSYHNSLYFLCHCHFIDNFPNKELLHASPSPIKVSKLDLSISFSLSISLSLPLLFWPIEPLPAEERDQKFSDPPVKGQPPERIDRRQLKGNPPRVWKVHGHILVVKGQSPKSRERLRTNHTISNPMPVKGQPQERMERTRPNHIAVKGQPTREDGKATAKSYSS